MATNDRQILITQIVGEVLGITAETEQTFDWFINQHKPEHFLQHYASIRSIFVSLKGTANTDPVRKLKPDAYFGGKYNLLFEFDEIQHFSSSRMYTFRHYPIDLPLNYSITEWHDYCEANQAKANKYRATKHTVDFDFAGGRTSQRAYRDCFADFLPTLHGLNPTLRIAEFEVSNIKQNDALAKTVIEKLLAKKLKHL